MKILKNIENFCCRYKSYLLVLLLFVVAASISLGQNISSNYEIIETNVNNVEFKLYNENQESEVIIVFRKSNIDPIPPNAELNYKANTDYSQKNSSNLTGEDNMVIFNGVLSSEQFIVSNLEHNTDYAIDVYFNNNSTSNKNYQITTLAEEPTEQVGRMLNSVPTDNKLVVYYQKGNGEKSYLLVGENIEPTIPEDGKIYSTTNNINTTSRIDDNTFIFLSDNNKEFYIEGLKPSKTYYLMAIEANGNNTKVNYLVSIDKNTRQVTTEPEAPKNVIVTIEKNKRFKLQWEKPENVSNYELDVAYDSEFMNKLENFDSIRFGDTDRFIIGGIKKNKNYYIRIRSINENGFSSYTETLVNRIE